MNRQAASSGPGFQSSQYGGVGQQKDPTQALQKRKLEEELKQDLVTEKKQRMYVEKLLERACHELKRYQDRFGHHFQFQELDDHSQDDQLHQHEGYRGKFEVQDLEPLILSYEENIFELNQLVSNLSREVTDLENKANKLVEENQSFRKELEKKCEMILNLYKNGDPNNNVANVYTCILQDDLKEKLKVSIEENDAIISSFKELQGKFREKGGERDLAIQRLNEQIKKYDDLMKKHTNQTQEFDQVKSKYESTMEDNQQIVMKQTKVQTVAHSLEQERSKLDKESKLWKSKSQQYQRELDETHKKLKGENDVLDRERRRLDQMCKDLEVEVDTLKNKVKRNEEDIDHNQKELYKNKQDFDQSKRLNTEDERRIKVFVGKEEQHIKSQTTTQQQLQETTLERDSAEVQVKQLEATLNNINRKHDDEVKQLKSQTDNMVEGVRTKARRLLEERDDQIDTLSIQNNEIQVELERYIKENHKIKQDILELEHKLRNQRNIFQTEDDYLKNRVSELEDQIERREKFNYDKLAGLLLDKQALDNQIRDNQSIINDLRQQLDQVRKRAMHFENVNKEQKDKLAQIFHERHQHSSPLKY